MKIIRSFNELQEIRNNLTGTVGLVPTMGALHEGHLSLVRQIRPHVDHVIVSIFVNPTQFGEGEDFSKYPRMVDEDIATLSSLRAERGNPRDNSWIAASPLAPRNDEIGLVDYVYLPNIQDIYGQNPQTQIQITGELNVVLEAKFRPTHFNGVATVVNILLNQTRATHAIFGEKDYQQLLVIKQMVADLSLPTKILSAPIMREADGLAMSSRNKYLSEDERKIAPLLYSSLRTERGNPRDNLEKAGFKIQYFEKKWDRALAAVYLGNTRLIDNALFPA